MEPERFIEDFIRLRLNTPQPRWAGFLVHSNKLQGILAKANKKFLLLSDECYRLMAREKQPLGWRCIPIDG